jgi:hypothetical protein
MERDHTEDGEVGGRIILKLYLSEKGYGDMRGNGQFPFRFFN